MVLLVIMVSVLVCWWWKGRQELQAVRQEVVILQKEIDTIIGANSSLQSRIDSVDDSFFLETEARERLGMARAGEVVYYFVSDGAILQQEYVHGQPEAN